MAQVSAADTPIATDVAKPPLGDALFSGNWYRVSALKPRLRGHVRIHRHIYRGEIWYVVEDRVAGKYHRFNPSSYRVIGLLDGQRTLQAVWDRLTASLDDHTPSQDELVQLFGQLYAADLIQCDVTPDVAELFERGGRQRRSRWLQRFANPVSLRFPLLDPDALLTRIVAALGSLLRTPGLLLWLLVVLPALLIAPSHWRELTGNFNERLLAVDNLLLLAVLFPLLKAAHELGHGLACKRYGGEVHEMGVMLLVFFPVPYVDASSASTFASRWQRMLVGAAGMLTGAALVLVVALFGVPVPYHSVAAELHAVYRLDVVAVPTHKPDQRRTLPVRLMATQAHKWQAVAETLLSHQAAGRPVLVGTRSVRASEALSELLLTQRCVHRVLNARQDAHEADVIAQAGQSGTITVATNMAGRGTDIHLGDCVAQRGGLVVVVLTECHDSARIDRQLVGRGARQGDPGIAQAIVALDDEIFHAHARWLQALLHASMRRRTLRADRQLDNLLGFAGNQI